jgi:hypothetical protein
MRPGTNTTIQSQLPPTTPPTNTGTWFVVGIAAQGPTTPQAATSPAQWQAIYGGRGSNPLLSDAVETYFAQGGSRVYTARVVGPAAIAASVDLMDAETPTPAASCTISAIGPGAYANGWQIVIATATGGITVTVEDSTGKVLEESNVIATLADLEAYAEGSSLIAVTVTGTQLPAPGTFALASGDDDIANVVTAQYTAALAQFNWDLGPGQVSAPGVTTTAILTAVVDHADASIGTAGSRVAYCELPDSDVAATLTGDASPIRSLGTAARRAALFTPWMDIAPATGTSGRRAVPPSAFAAGKAAFNDTTTGNPNQAAAGIRGILSTAVRAHATFSDADRETLNNAGINVIRPMAGGFRIYGNVTAVDRNTDPLYYQLANVRLDMAIEVQANAIQEEYMFSQIDGGGTDAADLGNELVNMLTNWLTLKALFIGANGTAFTVDTASDVNTPATAQEGELLATIAYCRSPGAEQVNLNIVRATVAQGV